MTASGRRKWKKIGTRGPCLRTLWSGIEVFDEETFARETHESSDASESKCGPYWGPKPVNSGGISFDTFKHMDNGWRAPRELPPICSSRCTFHAAIILATVSRCKLFQGALGHGEDMKKQPSARPAGSLLVIEPLEVPAPSERVPAPLEQAPPEIVHPIQYGIAPKRLCLDAPRRRNPLWVRRRRLVHTRWVYCVENIRSRLNTGTPLGESRECQANVSWLPRPETQFTQPENRCNNDVPKRLRQQTRLSI